MGDSSAFGEVSQFADASQSPVAAALQTADLEQQASAFRALLAGPATGEEQAAGEQQLTIMQPADLALPSGPQAGPMGELALRLLRLRSTREEADSSAAMSAALYPGAPEAEAAAAAAGPDASLVELFERHVRRAMQTVASDGSSGDEVRIELSDAVLPGTALSLRRAVGGWQLLVSSDNQQSLDRIAQHGSSLKQRFASAKLGSLEILTRSDLQ